MLIDDETGTYWDHITGEAVHGPLKGQKMAYWPLKITTVAAARERNPKMEIYLSSHRSLVSIFMRISYHFRMKINKNGTIPRPFRRTMASKDTRLAELTQGLGVVVDGEARYYRMSDIFKTGLIDKWGERTLIVRRGLEDSIPLAEWQDDKSRPFQMLSRWYGFAYTFPKCAIYGKGDRH